MQPNETEERVLDKQLDEICDGLREAVEREVETLQREGLPIYVSDNGHVIDLQTNKPPK
jgi:biotin operon repressor